MDEHDAAAADGAVDEANAGPTLLDLEDRLRRTAADLDNLRKRYAREVARERAAERTRAASMWLPIVDDIERAIEHGGGECEGLVAGIRAVRDHALSVLQALGYRRVDDVGVPFDPTRHEVVAAVEDEAPPGTVVQVVRPGYGNDEEVLRPAAVVVARSGG